MKVDFFQLVVSASAILGIFVIWDISKKACHTVCDLAKAPFIDTDSAEEESD